MACTERWTHYQLGDRDLATFTASVVKDLTALVVVHDRYQNYDSAELGTLRDRRTDVLRFVDDLPVPPTSNQAERDL